jgi:hypothetical protein
MPVRPGDPCPPPRTGPAAAREADERFQQELAEEIGRLFPGCPSGGLALRQDQLSSLSSD